MSLLEEDVVLVGTTEEGGSKVALPITRVNNVEGLGRYAGTTYSVDDVVYVDSNMQVALKCTQGGTTSTEELDLTGKAVGAEVEDGGVVWVVIPRGVMQGTTSTANGVEGLVPAPSAGSENKALCGDGSYKVLPISGGGTGASTASDALVNLGALPLAGGTMTGLLNLKSESTILPRGNTEGGKLWFLGDDGFIDMYIDNVADNMRIVGVTKSGAVASIATMPLVSNSIIPLVVNAIQHYKTSGYFFLANYNLLIQWGSVDIPNKSITVTLPLAFPSENYTCIANGLSVGAGTAYVVNNVPSLQTTTTITLSANQTNAGAVWVAFYAQI